MNLFTLSLMVAGGIVLILAVIGLIIAISERGAKKKRAAYLRSLWESPSGLSWSPPGIIPMPELTTPPSQALISTQALDHAVPSEPVAPTPTAEETDATLAYDANEDAALQQLRQQAAAEEAASLDTTQAMDGTPDFMESVPEETPIPEAVEALPPADRILYLDPEFELAEIKRILRIWSMLPDEDFEQSQLWQSDDGTTVKLLTETDKGYPCLELRGDMAEDLAEYLPEDLPIIPTLSA